MQRDTLMRYYALLLGIAFTLAGIGGFIGGITQPMPPDAPALGIDASYGLLLGLFPINVIHNLFHLAIGIGGVLAYRGTISVVGFLRVFGWTLAALALLGLIPAFNVLFGVMPIFGHDIWLHGLEAALALYLVYVMKASPAPQHP